MWVSKPIYESLPYFYLSVGVISLMASMYLNHWYWPTICFVLGLSTLVGGLVLIFFSPILYSAIDQPSFGIVLGASCQDSCETEDRSDEQNRGEYGQQH